MTKVAVVTGAGAGVGRAVVDEFARQGYDLGLLSRDEARLQSAAESVGARGQRALAISTDVADHAAVDAAATRIEQELGPIVVWVNVAMATVFSPVSKLTAEEIERATKVTYLGQVHGMMAALKRMRTRRRGTIVNVGSALAYRAIPLQAPYCGAKFAIRGFTDSLRSEIIHDGLDIRLAMVDLPAVNTPQFDWSLNKMGRKAMPVPPIFQPEVAAKAIFFAATHRRREVWTGFSTVKAIVANWFAPALLDRYLARAGYSGQTTDEALEPGAPSNLFAPVPGPYGAHGRFDDKATVWSWELFVDQNRGVLLTSAVLGAAYLLARMSRPRRVSKTFARRVDRSALPIRQATIRARAR